MRRIDYLITAVRNIGKNQNFSSTEGIQDEQIIQYMNDAQDYLQSALNAGSTINKPFVTEKIISIVANQDGFSVPGRILYNKEIEQVEYSYDGQLANYRVLDKAHFINRVTNSSNFVEGYYVRGNKIYLIPIPNVSQGNLRVMYEYNLDDLDKRRGTVSVINGLTSTTFTDMVLASDADESSTPNLSTIDYICINDKDGNVKVYNIPVGSYVTGTNTLTPAAGFTFQTGETFAPGDFVTFGKYSTTHSKLPDECETYLVHYAVEQLLHTDSSDDTPRESAILQRLEQGILTASRGQTAEVARIPQVDWDEWY